MNVAGIDVGTSGAICIIASEDNHIIDQFRDMPTLKGEKGAEIDAPAIRDMLEDWGVGHCIIEKAQSMPKQGVSSMFKYGTGYGILRGICVGLGIPYSLVHPATWKKAMLKDQGKGKDESIIRAQQLYPDLKLTRKKDHGIADAILLARYGIIMLKI